MVDREAVAQEPTKEEARTIQWFLSLTKLVREGQRHEHAEVAVA